MKYSHCPNCGAEYGANNEPGKLSCTNCRSVFYINSKPTASVIITDNDRILLGKRRIEPPKGKWDIIGGFLNLGESPEDGARREAKEETGLEVRISGLLGFFMDTYETTGDSTLNICFVAEVVGGDLTAQDDVEELKWFSADAIPDNLAFKNGEEMIEAWLTTRSA